MYRQDRVNPRRSQHQGMRSRTPTANFAQRPMADSSCELADAGKYAKETMNAVSGQGRISASSDSFGDLYPHGVAGLLEKLHRVLNVADDFRAALVTACFLRADKHRYRRCTRASMRTLWRQGILRSRCLLSRKINAHSGSCLLVYSFRLRTMSVLPFKSDDDITDREGVAPLVRTDFLPR
jgi:hypothetical protein